MSLHPISDLSENYPSISFAVFQVVVLKKFPYSLHVSWAPFHVMARSWVADGRDVLQIWRVASSKGWPSSSEVGRRANNSQYHYIHGLIPSVPGPAPIKILYCKMLWVTKLYKIVLSFNMKASIPRSKYQKFESRICYCLNLFTNVM